MQTYIKPCRHGQFLLLKGDVISINANLYGEWAEAEIALFHSLLESKSVVVEVGANIGLHSVPLSRICHEGRVFCFEPQRAIFHMLCGNLALNNRTNVTARQLGVSSKATRVMVQTTDYETLFNYGAFSVKAGFSTEEPFPGTVGEEELELIALDKDRALAALERLDLLKIDTEGMEVDILKGAKALIARHLPDIFVEIQSAEHAHAIRAQLGEDYLAYAFFSVRYNPNNFNKAACLLPEGHDKNIILRHRSRDQSVLSDRLVEITDAFTNETQLPLIAPVPVGA